jgi:hypothetical protein
MGRGGCRRTSCVLIIFNILSFVTHHMDFPTKSVVTSPTLLLQNSYYFETNFATCLHFLTDRFRNVNVIALFLLLFLYLLSFWIFVMWILCSRFNRSLKFEILWVKNCGDSTHPDTRALATCLDNCAHGRHRNLK